MPRGTARGGGSFLILTIPPLPFFLRRASRTRESASEPIGGINRWARPVLKPGIGGGGSGEPLDVDSQPTRR